MKNGISGFYFLFLQRNFIYMSNVSYAFKSSRWIKNRGIDMHMFIASEEKKKKKKKRKKNDRYPKS